jgi:hypothetical protein
VSEYEAHAINVLRKLRDLVVEFREELIRESKLPHYEHVTSGQWALVHAVRWLTEQLNVVMSAAAQIVGPHPSWNPGKVESQPAETAEVPVTPSASGNAPWLLSSNPGKVESSEMQAIREHVEKAELCTMPDEKGRPCVHCRALGFDGVHAVIKAGA